MVTLVLSLWSLSAAAFKLIPEAEISGSRAAKINERLLCRDKWPSQMRVAAKRHSRRSETLPSTSLSRCWGPAGHKLGEMSWGWEESAVIFPFFAEQKKKSWMVWLCKAMLCPPWSNSFRAVFSSHWLVTVKIEAPCRQHGVPGCTAGGLDSQGAHTVFGPVLRRTWRFHLVCTTVGQTVLLLYHSSACSRGYPPGLASQSVVLSQCCLQPVCRHNPCCSPKRSVLVRIKSASARRYKKDNSFAGKFLFSILAPVGRNQTKPSHHHFGRPPLQLELSLQAGLSVLCPPLHLRQSINTATLRVHSVTNAPAVPVVGVSHMCCSRTSCHHTHCFGLCLQLSLPPYYERLSIILSIDSKPEPVQRKDNK